MHLRPNVRVRTQDDHCRLRCQPFDFQESTQRRGLDLIQLHQKNSGHPGIEERTHYRRANTRPYLEACTQQEISEYVIRARRIDQENDFTHCSCTSAGARLRVLNELFEIEHYCLPPDVEPIPS